MDDEVLGHLGNMDHQQRSPLEEFDDEVPVRNAEERVLSDGVKAEVLGERGAIDAERVPPKGARPQRRSVQTGEEVVQPLEVVEVEEGVGEDVVRPSDRLCSLQSKG